MNKSQIKWWLIITLFALSYPVFSQKYSIHLAAFPEQIEPSFFVFAGFSDVHHQQNSLNFHQYSWGNFTTLEAAKNQLVILQKNPLLKGLTNLNILPLSTDYAVPTMDSGVSPKIEAIDFQLFSRSIYVSARSKGIQKMDVAIMEEVTNILRKYPSLKLRIITPTNSKKEFVTTSFAEVVENFLLAQNIPAYRIKTIPSPSYPSNQVKNSKKQQVIMTLVDLKEEIVLDKFSNNGLIVKQMSANNTIQVLE